MSYLSKNYAAKTGTFQKFSLFFNVFIGNLDLQMDFSTNSVEIVLPENNPLAVIPFENH